MMNFRMLIMLASTTLFGLICFGQTVPPTVTPPPAGILDRSWNQLVDEFFNMYFSFRPTAATAAGFHLYDSQLEDASRAAIDRRIAAEHQFLKKLEAYPTRDLSLLQRQDYVLMCDTLRASLLELEEIREWEKNPDRYSSGLSYSAFLIIARKYAPAAERLRVLTERERQMPATLAAARRNLKNPPRVYTEVAIEQMPGIIAFFQSDVPAAFKDVSDPKLLAGFRQANDAVIEALRKYEDFLRTDLLPQSRGDFRLGAENYRKKLAFEEMVDVPLDRLLEIGMADMHRNQAEFRAVAVQIDPHKTPQEILHQLELDHPSAGNLLQTFRDKFAGLREFIEQRKIVTIPSPVLPIVEETPPFMRALTSASMDTPGPYETKAKEAYFNVTLPEKAWAPPKIEEFLEGFNRGTIVSTAIHEAYPGHYTQFLWVQQAPSKVRKLLGAGSNAEGWAHYTEQMMLDEGYGKSAPDGTGTDVNFLKLRLGQLQDALLRNVRYVCGIQMHTGTLTLEQCTDMFVKDGYQTRAVAEREAKRGTSDPTYLVYTLGKLEILKLRDDYRRKMGDKFNLKAFHDEFLQQGFPPVKLVRETMMGYDSPVL